MAKAQTETARSSGETLQPGSGEPMQTAPEDAETRRGLKISAELPNDDPRSEVRGRGIKWLINLIQFTFIVNHFICSKIICNSFFVIHFHPRYF